MDPHQQIPSRKDGLKELRESVTGARNDSSSSCRERRASVSAGAHSGGGRAGGQKEESNSTVQKHGKSAEHGEILSTRHERKVSISVEETPKEGGLGEQKRIAGTVRDSSSSHHEKRAGVSAEEPSSEGGARGQKMETTGNTQKHVKFTKPSSEASSAQRERKTSVNDDKEYRIPDSDLDKETKQGGHGHVPAPAKQLVDLVIPNSTVRMDHGPQLVNMVISNPTLRIVHNIRLDMTGWQMLVLGCLISMFWPFFLLLTVVVVQAINAWLTDIKLLN
ncbi:hypothetical protein BKA70DRAFT_1219734 [Coprinopsis sp. MPI-PUGE-AT-0042]|nr:hypothetical protein BKA70DRAFT_1219734 [Coprinopsis sp. MPI-PUGE-AT-0042]